MENTTIYVVRHGESQGNRYNLFLGHTDKDLTEMGHKQAELTAEYLKGVRLDAIYSSDLMRAHHTAQHTADKVGLPVTTSKNLREIYAGEWEGRNFAELAEAYPETYDTWCRNIGCARCDGGESALEVQARVVGEVKKIAEQNSGKTVAIFTHATSLRMLKAAADNCPPEKVKDIPWASNASVSHFEYVDGVLRSVEYSIDYFMGDAVTALPKEGC